MASDEAVAEQRAHELAGKLSAFAAERRAVEARDIAAKSLAESSVLRFRADDRRLMLNDAHQVTLWPNRGHAAENAAPVKDVVAPTIAMVSGRHERTALRSGKNCSRFRLP
jgi:hypothetical protein